MLPIRDIVREPAAGKSTYHRALMGEAARGISRSHIGNSSAGPLTLVNKLRRPFTVGARPVPSAPISQGTLPGDASTTLNTTCFDVTQTILFILVLGARPVPSTPI